MPTMTLLEMVQSILSATDADEVNSIADTIEAEQAALVIKETFYDIIDNVPQPDYEGLIQLEGLADTDKPTYLHMPSEQNEIYWIKYDWQTNSDVTYVDLKYLQPLDFITRSMEASGNDDTQEVVDDSGVTLIIRTDANPCFWTSFDNEYIICDAFDISLEDTLQSSKVLCWGKREPTWEQVDEFVPDLRPNMFPYLLSAAKSTFYINYKVANPNEDKKARRQLVRSQNKKYRLNQRKPYDMHIDFGRK